MVKKQHHYFYIYLIGLLFGFGLIMSEMIYPAKVIGFLDIFGVWDPSLIFVMIGGIAVYAVLYFFTRHDTHGVLGYIKQMPEKKDIDARLVGGATLFGVGWGLAGFCPGPALVVAGTLQWDIFLFVIAMIMGMWSVGFWVKK